MIPELGHFSLVLALVIAFVQAVVPLVGARSNRAALMAVARPAAQGQFLFVAFAFGCLTWAFVANDFSVLYVASHSNTALPLYYRITAVWGSHEGSLLLWAFTLTMWTVAVTVFSRHLPEAFVARVLGVMGCVSTGFLAFLLFTSNPFERLLPAAAEGRDLNPLLQDPGMIIHPPLLYMGYVGFSVAFAFAIAALLSGRMDVAWARWSRPWTTVAWVFLTAGITVGSGWSYYELGWGGWWFWDPVENASFMPWLVGTALVHSLAVTEKRGAFKSWTALLAIAAFTLSLLGTFLVRSGVLTSVHTFATDPRRGVFILMILCVFIGGSLSFYAWRAASLKQGGLFAPISREGSLVLNNLLLTTACATVFVGTLYPLALEVLTGSKISVGAPFFNLTFAPLFLPLLLAVPFGPLLAWKRGDLVGAAQRLMAAGIGAMVTIAVVWAWEKGGSALAPLAIGLAVFVILGSVVDITERVKLFRAPLSTSWSRAKGLPRSTWGTAFAHAGLGIALIGIVCESTWNIEHIATMRLNDTAQLGSYSATFDGMTSRQGPNYQEHIATFTIRQGGVTIGTMTPSKRSFTTRGMSTTEAALMSRGASQIYISLGAAEPNGTITARIYYKPLVLLIWFGPVLMAFGGVLSLSDRRLRVGAPKPARPKFDGLAQPAE